MPLTLQPGLVDPRRPPLVLYSIPTTFHFLILPFLSIVYCKCHGFERTFFIISHILLYTPSPNLVFALTPPVFIKTSLGAISSALKVTGCNTVV